MNKISLILFLLFFSCNEKYNTQEQEETIEGLYHREASKLRGKTDYFIARNEIPWYFKEDSWLDYPNTIKNDVVCFFDSVGNIQFQAIVIEVVPSVKISALNTENGKYYSTELNVDSIRGFRRGELRYYKFYRHR